MRSRRLLFLFVAFYFVFLGGSAYYNLVFPVRVFHHLFVTALLGIWFFRKFRGDGLPNTPLNRPFYAAVIVWGISGLDSLDPRMAFEHLWFGLLQFAIFFVLADLFQRGRSRLVMETQFMLGAVVVLITGMEVASWFLGLGLTPNGAVGWLTSLRAGIIPELPRVALAMNISTLLAAYTAPLITLTIGWALTARRRDYRQALWLLVIGLSITLVLTFSRGGLLSVTTALGALGIMRFVQQPQVVRRISPGLLLGGVLAFSVVTIGVFSISQVRTGGDQIRVDLYRSAVSMLRDYPLTGVGAGMYGRAYRDYRTVGILTRDRLASAHNAYLNTAAESGLLGVAATLFIGVTVLLTWQRVWRQQNTTERKIRHEAAMAALLGAGVHSLVDVFTTGVVTVVMVLLAYSVIGHRRPFDERPQGSRWAAGVALLITLGYGLFFLRVDQAQIHYQRSLRDGSLEAAQQAEQLDPALNLYDLHIAYLLGENAIANPVMIEEAVAAYEHALRLEPSWDTGWINLAALERERGNIDTAINYMERAKAISPVQEPAWIYLAEMKDEASDRATKDVVRDYRSGIHWNEQENGRLPVSGYWLNTYRRLYALKEYLNQPTVNVEWEYRIFAELSPERAATLVKRTPTTAEEFWVSGEYALTVLGNPEQAEDYFTEAIRLNPKHGDYYVSRARATYMTNTDAARRDLDLGRLFGTHFEYPNYVQAWMTDDAEEVNRLLAISLPPRQIPQEFAAVLFGGRQATFDVLETFRPPGPGRRAMEPWYLLAQNYLSTGRQDDARRVYEAILEYAPDETEARQRLAYLVTPTAP
ncbi:MAG: hypothetical protein OHK0046_04060 [Anaerolineae bacterium]